MTRSKRRTWTRFLPMLGLTLIATVTAGWAGPLTGVNTGVMNFATTDQSMWQPGVTNGVTQPLFNVSNQDNPFDTNYSVNNEANTSICFFSSCYSTGTYGYAVNADLNGYIGVNSSVTLSAGAVTAQVPVDVTLGFPSSAAAGSAFNITSSGTFQPGASLSTFSPGVNLQTSVYGDLSGGVTAQACVVTCTGTVGPTLSTPSPPQQIKVISTNLTGNKTIPVTDPADGANIGSITVGTPFIPTNSEVTSSSQSVATPLTLSSTSVTSTVPIDPLLNVSANLSNAVAAIIGLPALAGQVGVGGTTLSYNIFSLNLGGGLGTVQNFYLTPTPQVAYNLVFIGDNGQNSNVLNGPVDVGTPFSVTIPNGYSAVEVTPTYSMLSPFINQTGFSADVSLNVSALSVGLGPISTGNLVNKTFTTGLGPTAYLPDYSYNLGGWNTFQGNTFTIYAGTVGAPEPRTLLLLAAGLLLLMAGLWSRRRNGGRRASQCV